MLAFFLSPLGRYIGIGLLALLVVGGWGEKRYWDGRAAYKAKIEKEIDRAKQTGDAARERALRDFDARGLPDSWFRD